MIFQSLDYLVFFVCVFTLYWQLPRRGQHVLLLAAGYFFYGYVHPWYCILLGVTTLVDFTFTRLMEDRPTRKRLWLGCILISNFSILAAFKYFGFFTDNVIAVLHLLGWEAAHPVFKMLLPAGVSFYTFQSCAYALDVYRGQTSARRSLLDYAVYVSFFPQLVAGPIERAGHLLAQFERPRLLNLGVARDAVFLILWGLVKKRVIADTAAVYCNKAFSVSDGTFPIIWAGALCFCVQVYADFSAYTDIARGSARLLGFDLCQNFNHPWLAQSPADFWRRWHMSLSSWFRDYVYFPLGGSRGSERLVARNLMLTFLLSGLWHGAGWNYVIWGGWWGALLVLWRGLDRWLPGFTQSTGTWRVMLRWSITMVLVNIGWLMFREQSFPDLLRQIRANPFSAPVEDWRIGGFFVAMMALYSTPLWLHAALQKPLLDHWEFRRDTRTGFVLQTVAGFALSLAFFTLASRVTSDFIYFQF